MPHQTEASSKTMPYFELYLEEKLDDSISSIGSIGSFGKEEEEILRTKMNAQQQKQRRRRASMEHVRVPATPVQQQRSAAVRRPNSVGNTSIRKRQYGGSSFGGQRTAAQAEPPKLEASRGVGVDATTSLRTLLASQMNREQRRSRRGGMLRDGSNPNLKATNNNNNNDLDNKGNSSHTRYSRRRLLADRSLRDLSVNDETAVEDTSTTKPPTTPTFNNSGLDIGGNSGHTTSGRQIRKMRFPRQMERFANGSCTSMDLEGNNSSRWAVQSTNASIMEDSSLRLPLRQMTREEQEQLEESSPDLAAKCRLSASTQDTAFSTICHDSMTILDVTRFEDSKEFGVLEVPKEDMPRKPMRQLTVDERGTAAISSSCGAEVPLLPRKPMRQLTLEPNQ